MAINNRLTPEQAVKYSRYKIYREYFGKFESCDVVAFAYCLSDAKMIVNALNSYYSSRPMVFSYVLCADYDEIFDEEV